MANVAELRLADPEQAVAGAILTGPSGGMADVAYTLNWLLSRGGCTTIHGEGWPDGNFVHSGAATDRFWVRLPTIQGTTSVSVTVLYTQTGGAGVVKVTTGAGTNSKPTAVGGPTELVIDAVPMGAGQDDLVFELTSASGDLTIHDLRVVPDPVGTPLAATALDGVRPFGVAAADADHPQSAARNEQIRAGLPVMRQRTRTLWVKGQLHSALGNGALREAIMHRSTFRIWRGAAGRVTYRFQALVQPHATLDKTLYWLLDDPRAWPVEWYPVTVPAGPDPVWIDDEFAIPEGFFLPGHPREVGAVGLYIDTLSAGYGTTSVPVYRVLVTGE